MTSSEYEKIRNKISEAKELGAKEKGALERINSQLEKDFGLHSKQEAIDYLKELGEKIKRKEEKRNDLIKELEEAVDWGSI